ncbi:serine/threonine-protein phosphatase, partial [bacterium]|nr:serine/threonine-protein phosphatase [bacterium]
FIYVNGGHVQPLLLTPGGDVFELKTGGPVLGPLPDAVYRRNYVNLRPGEVLVIVSDGVTERERLDGPADADGMREFGREGLIDLVSGILDHTASLIAAEIMRKIKEFGGNQPLKDDATVMVIRRLAAEDYPPAEGLLRLAGPIRR